MHGIYKIEQMLCDELDEIGEKGELTAGTLDTVDKLSHALKNTQHVIEYYETMGDHSNAGGSYARGGRMNGGRRGGANQYGSYGGRYGGRVYGRDGYSRADGTEGMIAELHSMMEDTSNPHIRSEIEKMISKIESM